MDLLCSNLVKSRRSRARVLFADNIGPAEAICYLSRYRDGIPERFFNCRVTRKLFGLLDEDVRAPMGSLRLILDESRGEFDIAFRGLREVNQLAFHDFELPNDVVNLHRFIHEYAAPVYLKLCESVAGVFLLPVAAREIRKKGKSLTNIKWWRRWEAAVRAGLCEQDVNSIRRIRNAIAHGGIEYKQDEVVFVDRSIGGASDGDRTVSLHPRYFISKVDTLLDFCNGLAAAYRLLFTWPEYVERLPVPQELVVDEASAQLNSASWEILGVLDSNLGDLGKQLNVSVKTGFFDVHKIAVYSSATAITMSAFLPAFDRYYIGIKGIAESLGWAVLTRDDLSSDGDGIVEVAAKLFSKKQFMMFPPYFMPASNPLGPLRRCGTLMEVMRNNWKAEEFKRRTLDNTEILVRLARLYRQGAFARLKASVVLTSPIKADLIPLLRVKLHYLVTLCSRVARFQRVTSAPTFLPLEFAQINVFLSDYRIRRLESFGLGEGFLCRVTLNRLGRVRHVPIRTSISERIGPYLVDWNSNTVSRGELGMESVRQA